jgi:DNA invertase Pin-like site-specific DNA recombinase
LGWSTYDPKREAVEDKMRALEAGITRLERATGLRVSVTTLHRAFKRLGMTRKKDKATFGAQ